MTKTAIPKILYVEDDSDDHIFLKESFLNYAAQAELVHAINGEAAIYLLDKISEGSQLPKLIVLDLNMPKKDGRQTLTYLKANPRFENIPVIILSTSENIRDKEICKALGAAQYFQKPYNFDGYKDIVKKFIDLLPHSTSIN